MSPKFLVTTHSGAFFVSASGGAERIAPGYFYGADFLPSGDILVAQRLSPHLEPNSPTRFSLRSPRGELIDEWGDETITNVHQLSVIKGTVYVCDTGHDRLVSFEARDPTMLLKSWYLSDAGHDTLHVNSVSYCLDSVVVNCHRRGEWPSWIVTIPAGTINPLAFASVHNIEWDGGDYVYYNNSLEGRLIRAPFGDELADAAGIGGHLKGLALDSSRVYVGVSGIASRAHRFTIQSHLAVLTREPFALEDIIDLSFEGAPIGNINEVRVFPNAN